METRCVWTFASSTLLALHLGATPLAFAGEIDETVTYWAMPASSSEPIDVNILGLSPVEAVRLIAGRPLNVYADAGVPAAVNLTAKGVPFGSALDFFLTQEDLAVRFEGDAVFLSDRESRTYQLPLVLDAEAPQWQALESGLAALKTSKGVLAVHKPAGIVTLEDRPSALRRCESFLARSMRAMNRQVEIEVKILEIVHDEDVGVGFDWSLLQGVLDPGWNLGGALGGGRLAQQSTRFGNDIFELGVLRAGKWEAFLEAFEQTGNVHVVSRPYITAMSNQRALFSVTERIPYLTKTVTQEGGVSTTQFALAFDEAGINLDLLASIGDDEAVTLKVKPIISSVVGFTPSLPDLGPQPIIDTREALSTVRLTTGSSLVLGGLMQDRETVNVTGIPVLSRIPLLGALFRSQEKRTETTEIVLLLTPRLREDGAIASLRTNDRLSVVNVDGMAASGAQALAAVHTGRALEQLTSGHVTGALSEAESAARLDPTSWWTINNLAVAQREAGFVALALATLQSAIQTTEEPSGLLRYNCGVLQLHRGETALAEGQLKAAAADESREWSNEALFAWATALEQGGRREEAEALLEAQSGRLRGEDLARLDARLERLRAARETAQVEPAPEK